MLKSLAADINAVAYYRCWPDDPTPVQQGNFSQNMPLPDHTAHIYVCLHGGGTVCHCGCLKSNRGSYLYSCNHLELK